MRLINLCCKRILLDQTWIGIPEQRRLKLTGHGMCDKQNVLPNNHLLTKRTRSLVCCQPTHLQKEDLDPIKIEILKNN